jgi:hypothetical protein
VTAAHWGKPSVVRKGGVIRTAAHLAGARAQGVPGRRVRPGHGLVLRAAPSAAELLKAWRDQGHVKVPHDSVEIIASSLAICSNARRGRCLRTVRVGFLRRDPTPFDASSVGGSPGLSTRDGGTPRRHLQETLPDPSRA